MGGFHDRRACWHYRDDAKYTDHVKTTPPTPLHVCSRQGRDSLLVSYNLIRATLVAQRVEHY
jgi:hypothetical protein